MTLICVVLSGIPIYFFSLLRTPCSMYNSLEKLMQDFLWERVDEGKSEHLVNWELARKSLSLGRVELGN